MRTLHTNAGSVLVIVQTDEIPILIRTSGEEPERIIQTA